MTWIGSISRFRESSGCSPFFFYQGWKWQDRALSKPHSNGMERRTKSATHDPPCSLNESFCEFLMLSIISVSINARSHSCGSGTSIFSRGFGRKWQVGLNFRPLAPRIGRPFLLIPRYWSFWSLSWCLIQVHSYVLKHENFNLLNTGINAPVVLKHIFLEFAVFSVQFRRHNARVRAHGNVEFSLFVLNCNDAQTNRN